MENYLSKTKKVARNVAGKVASNLYNNSPASAAVGLVKDTARTVSEVGGLIDSTRQAKKSERALAEKLRTVDAKKAPQVNYTPSRKPYEGRDTPLAPPRQFTAPQSPPKAPNYNPASNYASSFSTKDVSSASTPKAPLKKVSGMSSVDTTKLRAMKAARSAMLRRDYK